MEKIYKCVSHPNHFSLNRKNTLNPERFNLQGCHLIDAKYLEETYKVRHIVLKTYEIVLLFTYTGKETK